MRIVGIGRMLRKGSSYIMVMMMSISSMMIMIMIMIVTCKRAC